ncbi:MAG TPA: response regulator [Bacteroidales bacterium]|nr:response regulator [Bacteroidales bacterium]HOE05374.1 response regulator [Bacteroidales bacterium]HQL71224.1 response regulator [Bacteroidales bacterium]
MNTYKILVIDDEPVNVAAIKTILENEPIEILAAYNGWSGIEIATAEKPDLIILDCQMPVNDGYTTLVKLKKNPETQHIMVVMITGVMKSYYYVLNTLNAGAVDFIRKPFDETELKARLRSLLKLVDYHKKELSQKDVELVQSAIKLVKCNEFNIDVVQMLNQIIGEGNDKMVPVSKLIELREVIENKLHTDSWKQLEDHFNSVNPDFQTNLVSRHPNLTPSEIKLATLLRLNLSTKHIAGILYLSADSVRVARTRLRKKLDLKPESNLTAYIFSL